MIHLDMNPMVNGNTIPVFQPGSVPPPKDHCPEGSTVSEVTTKF